MCIRDSHYHRYRHYSRRPLRLRSGRHPLDRLSLIHIFVLLPKLDLAHEDFYEEEVDEEDCEEDEQEDGEGELVWTEAGRCFGAKLRESLVRIDAAFKAATSETPEPGWAEDKVYLLPRESEIQETLLSIEKRLKLSLIHI